MSSSSSGTQRAAAPASCATDESKDGHSNRSHHYFLAVAGIGGVAAGMALCLMYFKPNGAATARAPANQIQPVNMGNPAPAPQATAHDTIEESVSQAASTPKLPPR